MAMAKKITVDIEVNELLLRYLTSKDPKRFDAGLKLLLTQFYSGNRFVNAAWVFEISLLVFELIRQQLFAKQLCLDTEKILTTTDFFSNLNADRSCRSELLKPVEETFGFLFSKEVASIITTSEHAAEYVCKQLLD